MCVFNIKRLRVNAILGIDKNAKDFDDEPRRQHTTPSH